MISAVSIVARKSCSASSRRRLYLHRVGVLIFSALTAIDTQDARRMYREGQHDMNQRAVIWSALALYLDFINLMLHLLRFVGIKKD